MADSYRDSYRATQIPRWYSGKAHLAFTTAASLAGIAGAASQISTPTPAEWMAIPASFLVANTAEYLGHRFPMHRRYPGLGAVFRRHAGTHHKFFLAAEMDGTDDRDWHVTLFPPVLLTFFFGGIGLPIALALHWLTTPNVAWFFAATAAAYFLVYEWLHLSYHAAPRSFVASLPGLRQLAAHHRLHHDPKHMGFHNFNISFPLVDTLAGTRFRGD